MKPCLASSSRLSMNIKTNEKRANTNSAKSTMTTYDPKTRIWSREANPSDDFVPMGSYLGESIFKRFNEADPNQTAEINGDSGDVFTIENIHHGTITVSMNLQDLGAGPDDRIMIFCRTNSHISSIIYACYTLGIAFCPLDVMSCEYVFRF